MARLVIIIHDYDAFLVRNAAGRIDSPYLLFDVLGHLRRMGHKVDLARGPKPLEGDVALLHVDSTIVEQEYLELERHYPRTINFRTGDISKRRISRLVVAKGDPWAGPVMVKSNYNNNAFMEDLHNQGAARMGLPLPHPGVTKGGAYRVFEFSCRG